MSNKVIDDRKNPKCKMFSELEYMTCFGSCNDVWQKIPTTRNKENAICITGESLYDRIKVAEESLVVELQTELHIK